MFDLNGVERLHSQYLWADALGYSCFVPLGRGETADGTLAGRNKRVARICLRTGAELACFVQVTSAYSHVRRPAIFCEHNKHNYRQQIYADAPRLLRVMPRELVMTAKHSIKKKMPVRCRQ